MIVVFGSYVDHWFVVVDLVWFVVVCGVCIRGCFLLGQCVGLLCD